MHINFCGTENSMLFILQIEKVMSPSFTGQTNFTGFASETMKFQKLLSEILAKPISFELGFNISWLDSSTYLMVMQEFLHKMQSIITNLNFQR